MCVRRKSISRVAAEITVSDLTLCVIATKLTAFVPHAVGRGFSEVWGYRLSLEYKSR